ncbi:hypothetical protein AcW1_007304 [Taiwanofungus camphoratus]|nr:hypothetical protein AcW2_007629 [Antrodia cinnamomea]KAI0927458.1 hypothetical protein AcV5_007995 [Antrodia cinnamomea]KAI0952960.1 hypothetical protein AcW1_007304 [Antrodia cinnamomea]
MQVDQPSQLPRQYAILRIKRKRNEEPLDALVVDSRLRRKKSRSALNVFQFAETVEPGAWDDEQKKKDLEERLSALSRESSHKENRPALPASASATVGVHEQSAQAAAAPSVTSTTSSSTRPRPDDPNRTYTIIRSDRPLQWFEQSSQGRPPTAPPKVWSTKELNALHQSHSGLTMYDAVPSSSTLASVTSASSTTNTDAEVAKFLPLLKDYLRLNDMASPSASPSASSLPPTVSVAIGGDNDYVWDMFYQRPTTFQELFMPSTSVSGNIAKLTGLPPELEGLYDTDSDSEYAGEDDEDSNAEDWYKNDYPEEEDERSDEGSDVFHENSDYEDAMFNDPNDHDWR